MIQSPIGPDQVYCYEYERIEESDAAEEKQCVDTARLRTPDADHQSSVRSPSGDQKE